MKEEARPSFVVAAIGWLKELPELVAEVKLPPIAAMTAPLLLGLGVILTVAFLLILSYLQHPAANGKLVDYSQVLQMGTSHRVDTATLYQEDGIVVVRLHSGQTIYSPYPKSDALTADLVSALTGQNANTTNPVTTTTAPAPTESIKPATVRFDPQTTKGFLKFVDQLLMPLVILACFFSNFFLLITGKESG